MPPITALLHTENDALRLGRALEMLLPCAEIVIVDHASEDDTCRIARHYGARIFSASADSAFHYLDLASHPWILCLQPNESITEHLQATLYEWESPWLGGVPASGAFSVFVKEEMAGGWLDHASPETRIVSRNWSQWRGPLPAFDPSAKVLEGQVLRFAFP